MKLINPPQSVSQELDKRSWEDCIWPHLSDVPPLDRGAPCWVGESHAETYFHVKALNRPVSILHFDAHVDMDDTQNGLDHGNWLTHLWDEGLLLDVYQVGLRTEHHRPFPYSEGTNPPNAAAIANLRGPVFVSIDLDAFDPSVAPATGMRVPCGLSFADVRNTLQLVRGVELCGADIMEYDQSLDGSGVTASLIAGLVFELAYLLEN